jgi:hypothetical protein
MLRPCEVHDGQLPKRLDVLEGVAALQPLERRMHGVSERQVVVDFAREDHKPDPFGFPGGAGSIRHRQQSKHLLGGACQSVRPRVRRIREVFLLKAKVIVEGRDR